MYLLYVKLCAQSHDNVIQTPQNKYNHLARLSDVLGMRVRINHMRARVKPYLMGRTDRQPNETIAGNKHIVLACGYVRTVWWLTCTYCNP